MMNEFKIDTDTDTIAKILPKLAALNFSLADSVKLMPCL